MVKSFRVSDLQTLLASMGRSKSGLKQDLVGRALRLVQTEYSPELLKNVRQLYETRFPKASAWLAARRPESVPVNYPALNSSPRGTAQGTDYLNGISKPAPPPEAEVKLVPLPFYHNLETLLPAHRTKWVPLSWINNSPIIIGVSSRWGRNPLSWFCFCHSLQSLRTVRRCKRVNAFLN